MRRRGPAKIMVGAALIALTIAIAACDEGATRMLVIVETPRELTAERQLATSLELAIAGAEQWGEDTTLGRACLAEERILFYPRAGAHGAVDVGVALRDGQHRAVLAGVVHSIALLPGGLTEAHVVLAAQPSFAWAADLAASTVEVDRSSGVIADGHDSALVRASIVDSAGAALPSLPVRIELVGDANGARILQPLPTNDHGRTAGRLASNVVATHRIRARVGDTPRLLRDAPQVSFTVDPERRLVFVQQPTSGMRPGETWATPLRVAVVDRDGTAVRGLDLPVRLSLAENPDYASLWGQTRASMVDGEARFEGLRVELPGDYTLVATAPGLAEGRSAPFTVTPGAWRERNRGLWGTSPGGLYAHPTQPGYVVLQTARGLYRTTNGGETWTLADPSQATYVIDFSPSETEVFYALNATTLVGPDSLRRTDTMGDGFRTLPVAGLPPDFAPVVRWVDGRDPNTIYLGDRAFGSRTDNYVYRSRDGGLTVEAAAAGLSAGASFGVFAFAQTATSLLVAIAADDYFGVRLYRSRDSGDTWTPLALPGSGSASIRRLVADRLSQTFYAVTSDGIFRSTDDGETFVLAIAGLPTAFASDLDLSPADPGRLVAIVSDGTSDALYRSDDRGATWQRASKESLDAPFSARFDADGQRLYVISVAQFLVSEDGGQTFSSRSRGLRDVRIADFALAPGGQRFVTLSNGTVYQSVDDGASWSPAARAEPPAHLAVGPSRVWVVGSGPRVLTRSLASPEAFADVSPPQGLDFTNDAAADPIDDALYIASDSGNWRCDASRATPCALWPASPSAPVERVAVDPAATAAGGVLRGERIGNARRLARSSDGGASATLLTWPGAAFASLALRGNRLIASDNVGKLFRSLDGGSSFSDLTGKGGVPDKCISFVWGQGDVIWMTSPTALYRSKDGGDTAVEVPPPPGYFVSSNNLFAGRSPDEVIVATPITGLWVTTTAGQ